MSRNYYVVALYVDELEEGLVMRCSTIEGAGHISEILNEEFPNATFDVSDEEPKIHLRNYAPDWFNEIKNKIVSSRVSSKPKLIVIDGGKE